jgi:Protein of unknown function DUF45
MPVHSALFFETIEEIYRRVFLELKPRTPPPEIRIHFRRFANVNSSIKMEGSSIEVKLPDLLEGAPVPVMESLAWILFSKLFRRPVPRTHSHRFKLFLNRQEVRRTMHLLKQQRGRKFVSGPIGERYHLEEIFESLNLRFFNGLMARPQLGWSRAKSRTLLGHYDPAHNAIILSRILDSVATPPLAVEYVMFHEMLHLRHPVEHAGARRRIHTAEFRAAEKQFPDLKLAKEQLKKL